MPVVADGQISFLFAAKMLDVFQWKFTMYLQQYYVRILTILKKDMA